MGEPARKMRLNEPHRRALRRDRPPGGGSRPCRSISARRAAIKFGAASNSRSATALQPVTSGADDRGQIRDGAFGARQGPPARREQDSAERAPVVRRDRPAAAAPPEEAGRSAIRVRPG